jgi:hypothetical protein
MLRSLAENSHAAYREKYSSSPYLKPMIADRVRAATVRISPRT